MKIVAQRTGLSPHVVRVWEKRYGAVEPNRSGTNRRLYSDSDIDRLALLHKLTKAGHSIGQVASLSTQQLQQLAKQSDGEDTSLFSQIEQPAGESQDQIQRYLEAALRACREMDQVRLEEVLDKAVVELGYSGLIEQLAGPLITAIGEEWHNGTMTAAQEHAATATIRSHIDKHVRLYPVGHNAPTVVITTPAGQIHELGAVLATAAARKVGWNVVYLGASLPAAEIASAVKQCSAEALALSISFPADDRELPSELTLLRSLVGKLPIFAGGRCAPAYAKALKKTNILHLEGLPDLREQLLRLRGHHIDPSPSGATAEAAG